jgi:hypothetical protein
VSTCKNKSFGSGKMHGGAAAKAEICIVGMREVAAEQLWRVILISASADGSLRSEACSSVQSTSVNTARSVCFASEESRRDTDAQVTD